MSIGTQWTTMFVLEMLVCNTFAPRLYDVQNASRITASTRS